MRYQHLSHLAHLLLSFVDMRSSSLDSGATGKGVDGTRTGTGLVTVKGIVIPVDWDANGNVLATVISTFDEDEYLIDKNAQGNELKALMRQAVEVYGEVRLEKERKIITVKSYKSTV